VSAYQHRHQSKFCLFSLGLVPVSVLPGALGGLAGNNGFFRVVVAGTGGSIGYQLRQSNSARFSWAQQARKSCLARRQRATCPQTDPEFSTAAPPQSVPCRSPACWFAHQVLLAFPLGEQPQRSDPRAWSWALGTQLQFHLHRLGAPGAAAAYRNPRQAAPAHSVIPEDASRWNWNGTSGLAD